MDAIREWLRERKVSIPFAALGLIFLGVGVMQMRRVTEAPEVEVVEPGELIKETGVVVDVAGAVKSPGVFRLNQGARVAEAVEAAGGLTDGADGDYVARFVNQAEVVKDGMKIFIPMAGAISPGEVGDAGEGIGGGGVAGGGLVNVNTASLSELDALWGIGEARANDIVMNRPYGDLAELETKAGIPKNVMERNQGKMSVY
jgi:competence protein ComEA